MEKGESRYTVVFFNSAIQINYDGTEILYWHDTEWKEDPEIVYAIVNAAYNAGLGSDVLKEYVDRRKAQRKA